MAEGTPTKSSDLKSRTVRSASKEIEMKDNFVQSQRTIFNEAQFTGDQGNVLSNLFHSADDRSEDFGCALSERGIILALCNYYDEMRASNYRFELRYFTKGSFIYYCTLLLKAFEIEMQLYNQNGFGDMTLINARQRFRELLGDVTYMPKILYDLLCAIRPVTLSGGSRLRFVINEETAPEIYDANGTFAYNNINNAARALNNDEPEMMAQFRASLRTLLGVEIDTCNGNAYNTALNINNPNAGVGFNANNLIEANAHTTLAPGFVAQLVAPVMPGLVLAAAATFDSRFCISLPTISLVKAALHKNQSLFGTVSKFPSQEGTGMIGSYLRATVVDLTITNIPRTINLEFDERIDGLNLLIGVVIQGNSVIGDGNVNYCIYNPANIPEILVRFDNVINTGIANKFLYVVKQDYVNYLTKFTFSYVKGKQDKKFN